MKVTMIQKVKAKDISLEFEGSAPVLLTICFKRRIVGSSDKNQNLDDSRETQCTSPSLVPFCKINPHLKCAFNSENRILKKAINRKFKYTPLLKRCAERGIASSTTSMFKINENSPNVAVIAKIPSKTEVLDSLIFPIEESLVLDTNIICGLDSEKGCCAIVPYTYECFNSNHSTDGKIRILSLQKTADCCMGQLRIDYEMVIPNCLQLETLGTLEIQSFRTVPYRNRHTTSVITCKLQSTNTFPKIKIKELDSDHGVIPEKMFEINSSEDIFLTATINASRKKGRKQKLFRHTNYSEKLTFSPTQCHGRLMSFMNRNRGYTQSKLMLEIEKELRPIKEQIKELQRSMTNVNVINCRSKKGVKNGYISQIFTRLHEEGCSDLDTEDGPTRLSPMAEMYIKLSRY
ncbi:hypothetical protein J6590_068991 [Homalodisca vitripennis]|nr:hypothetical protein J6590_068991 [Homalodisca vitripennis]